MLRKLVIIDASSVIYAGHDGRMRSNTIKGIPVGGVRHLMYIVFTEITADNSVLVCFDSKTDKGVKNPSFKSNRTKNINIVLQCEMALEIMQATNIPVMIRENYEADDLVAEAVAYAAEEFSRIEIITGDSDLAANIIKPSISIQGSASIYPSIYNDNYHAVIKQGVIVPYNAVLPYYFFMGKDSNAMKAFMQGSGKSKEAFDDFMAFCTEQNYRTEYLSKTSVMASYISHLVETGKIVGDEELARWLDRIEGIYPRPLDDDAYVKASVWPVTQKDIKFERLQFYCKILETYRVTALFGDISMGSSTPYTPAMTEWILAYKQVADSGDLAAKNNITPDVSHFMGDVGPNDTGKAEVHTMQFVEEDVSGGAF